METFLGFAAAFATAVAKSATDVGTKYATRALPERVILAVGWTFSAGALWIVCAAWYPSLWSDPVAGFRSMIGPNFWWVLVLDGVLNAIASYFYIRAFRHSDASLVAPFMLFTPVLLLMTSPLMLGQKIPLVGAFGVLCTVIGAFFLGAERGFLKRLGSLRQLAADAGARSMLLTAAIWSVTSNLDKIGVDSAPILLWSASISTVIALYSVAFMLLMDGFPPMRGAWRAMIPGGTSALGTVLQMYALTVLFVPYVIAIKRLSSLFTVVAGGALFQEKSHDRLIGTLIMLAGTILIALGS